MVTALDVAGYVKLHGRVAGYDSMRLQKLVYFAQAWHMAWTGKPLFEDDIEAWPNGPVVACVYRRFRYSFLPTPSEDFPEDARETLDAVINHYGVYTYQQLIDLTHADAPWRDARKGLDEDAASNNRLDRSLMMDFYVKKAILGEDVPQRPANVHDAGPRMALAHARNAIKEWAEGLELLASK